MIEKLFYINEKSESIEFSAAGLYHVNVAKTAGISDVRNKLYTTESMGQDGETCTGNKIQSRVITVNGAIRAANKDIIANARRRLNRVLNPHLTAVLLYEYGSVRRVINCRLETAPVFNRGNALLSFTIDALCPYPFWQDEDETETVISGWLGGLEFPIDTGGLEIPQDAGMEFGTLTPDAVVAVINNGDIAAGVRVEFLAFGTVPNPRLTNVDTAEYMAFALTLQDGDRLVVTTEYGNKACTLYRDGQAINALPYWDIGGKFLQLETGNNYFQYTADANANRLETVVYATNQYLGV
jgi:hypothetical protein